MNIDPHFIVDPTDLRPFHERWAEAGDNERRAAEKVASWKRYFMQMADLVASRSEDLSTHVGCVIVGPDNDVRATGYNGMPRGVKALPERLERPEKYRWTAHAEVSAIGNAARSGVSVNGCTAYISHLCCAGCTRLLIQAGIRKVVYGPGKTSMPAEEFEAAQTMFFEASVELEPFNP